MAIYKMKNSVRHYPWGDKEFLPNMLEIQNKEGEPFAELWIGAHHSAPSKLCSNDNGKEVPISEILEIDGKSSLPFLLKILCAASPLSLQVHPDKKHAEEMFEEENKRKLSLDAFTRNYKDANHKPEILFALTPFQALRGFRPIPEIVNFFTPLSSAIPHSLLIILEKMKKDKTKPHRINPTLKDFFTKLSNLESKEKEELIGFALDQIQMKESQINIKPAHLWVKKLNSLYPRDIGVLAPYFLNLIKLNPGEAIFLDAGYIHSYLEGSGIELMANSDNVLRSGLTPKNIDIPELLKVVKFESEDLELVKKEEFVIQGDRQDKKNSPWIRYITQAKDFTLLKAEGEIETKLPGTYARVVLVTEGTVSLKEKDGPLIRANKGESLFIPYSSKNETSEEISVSGNGTIFLALSDTYFTNS